MNRNAQIQEILNQMQQYAPNILGECIARHAGQRGVEQEDMWHGDLRTELKMSVERVFDLWLQRTGLKELGYRVDIQLCEEFRQFQLNIYPSRLYIH